MRKKSSLAHTFISYQTSETLQVGTHILQYLYLIYIYTSITKARITHLSFCFFISLLPDVSGGRGDGPTRETISILRGLKRGNCCSFSTLNPGRVPCLRFWQEAQLQFLCFLSINLVVDRSKTKIPRQIWLKWSEGQLLQFFGSNEDQYINICKINGGLVFTHQHTHTGFMNKYV